MTDRLKAAIETIIDESQRLGVEGFEHALDAVADEIATGERDDDLFQESVIDGIRWGAHAAVTVELGGGAMLRVILPDGARITHEWASHADADPSIKAALAAVMAERTTAGGAGE